MSATPYDAQNSLKDHHAAMENEGPRECAVTKTLLGQGLIIFGTIIRTGMNLAIMPLLIALLGHDDYALWITISSATLILSLSEGGLGQSVVNRVGMAYAQHDFAEANQVQATAFVLYWLVTVPLLIIVLAALVALPIDGWLLRTEDMHKGGLLRMGLALSAALALLRIPFQIFPAMLSAVRHLPTRLICEISLAVMSTAVGLLAAAWGGLLATLAAMNLTLLGGTAMLGWLCHQRCPWFEIRFRSFRRDLVVPLAANSGFFFLMSAATLMDRVAVQLLATKLGTLALTAPMFLIVSLHRVTAWSMISSLSRAAQPYFLMWNATGRKQETVAITQLCTKCTCALASFFVLLAVPFGSDFVNWWLGSPCCPSQQVLILIAAAFYVDAVFIASIDVLVVSNRHRWLAVMLFIKALLVCGLAGVFSQMGMEPALAIAAGMIGGSLVGASTVPAIYCSAFPVKMTGYAVGFLGRPLMHGVMTFAIAWGLCSVTALSARLAWTGVASAGVLAMVFLCLLNASERQYGLHAARKLRLTPWWPRSMVRQPACEG